MKELIRKQVHLHESMREAYGLRTAINLTDKEKKWITNPSWKISRGQTKNKHIMVGRSGISANKKQ